MAQSTAFFAYRIRKAPEHHQQLYRLLPKPLADGLRYIHKFNAKRDKELDVKFLTECLAKFAEHIFSDQEQLL